MVKISLLTKKRRGLIKSMSLICLGKGWWGWSKLSWERAISLTLNRRGTVYGCYFCHAKETVIGLEFNVIENWWWLFKSLRTILEDLRWWPHVDIRGGGFWTLVPVFFRGENGLLSPLFFFFLFFLSNILTFFSN